MNLTWVSLVTILALIMYIVVMVNVGRARAKYGVQPPSISGNPDFERVYRVQQNTLEQLIVFLPALWIFAYFINPIAAAILGAVWIGGRILFAWGYYQAAEKRRPGFAIGVLVTMTLLLGSLIGIGINLVKG
jgi:glutathione S-transferase